MIFTKGFLKKFHSAASVTLLLSGDDYFNTIVQLIDAAKKEIHLQVYIFDEDKTGNEVVQALIKAASRGVTVYLLFDAYGCNHLSEAFIQQLRRPGITLRFYSPVNLWTLKFGRRLHHKVLVIDRSIVVISGINIADRYRGNHNEKPWLDFGVVIKAAVAEQVAGICFNLLQRKWKRTNKHYRRKKKSVLPMDGLLVRIRQHDWIRAKRSISSGYLYAIRHARASITIVASYFLPGKTIMRALRKAAQRNVKIRILFSEKTDAVLMKRATNYLYYWLFKYNIKIYEYQPAMVHGKIAIVDKQWATIGSYNLNHLSEYGSVEMNADVVSSEWVSRMNDQIEKIIIQDSRPVDASRFFTGKGFSGRIGDRLSFYLMRVVFWLIRNLTEHEQRIS